MANVLQKKTKSSPQWWSGRSTTTHDVLKSVVADFQPPFWGTWRLGISSFDSPHGLLLAPYWHIRSISYRFWVIQLSPKVFPLVRPTLIWWQIPLRWSAKMKHLNHCFQNCINVFLKIRLTAIEKSWSKHDSKWTSLCDLLPSASRFRFNFSH